MLIYNLLEYISILSLVCFCIFLYFIYRVIKSTIKKESKSFAYYLMRVQSKVYNIAEGFTPMILVLIIVSTLVTSEVAQQIIGIHNLETKSNGIYCFYVAASQNGGESYTLPARIRIATETYDDHDGKNHKTTVYYIEKVYFPNGSFLEIGDSQAVRINESAQHYTSDGDEWSLTLLNKHAYSPYVEETNRLSPVNISLLVIRLSSTTFVLYACLRKESNTHGN